MKNIDIVEYKNEYRESVIALLSNTFTGCSDEFTFTWRFEQQEIEKPIILCALDAGKVISFNSWIRWTFIWEGKTFIGYQSGESATDKNYRRLGIWEKVVKFGEKIARERENVDFFFGFPAAISIGGLLKAGYMHVGTYNKSVIFINPLLMRQDLRQERPAWSMDNIQNYEVSKISPVTDARYFEWRYSLNPKKYQVERYTDDDKVSLFVINKHTYFNKKYKISFPEIQLLDWQFTSNDENFINHSFGYLEKLFSREAIWITTFFNQNTNKGQLLSKRFRVNFRNRGVSLLVKRINPSLDDKLLYDFNNWDLMPHVVDSN